MKPALLAALLTATLALPAAVYAQGANCQLFMTPAQVSDNAGASPHVCAFDSVRNAAANTNIRHVLLYDWTAGGHNKGHTQRHMLRLARDYGFRLDRSQDSTYITAATLQGVDIVVINNSDGDAFQNSTSLQAMRNYVEVRGGAMFLIHAAAAFIPCPNEDLEDPGCRWIMRALRTQFWRHNNHASNTVGRIYADSVRIGEIPPISSRYSGDAGSHPAAIPSETNHGRKHSATRNIFRELPHNGMPGALAEHPYVWEGLWDEWFTYRNYPRLEGTRVMDDVTYGPIHVLLSLDEDSQAANAVPCSVGSPDCWMGDRPISWTRTMGNGVAAYNTAGHGDVYVRSRVVGNAIVNDSLMEKYNWRLMKYLARDFTGCMAPEDPRYNPQATVLALTPVDDPCPCAVAANCSVTSVRQGVESGSAPRVGIEWHAGGLRVSLADPGRHRIRVLDALGREVFSTAAQGGGGAVTVPGLRRGAHFVEVQGPGGTRFSERVVGDAGD